MVSFSFVVSADFPTEEELVRVLSQFDRLSALLVDTSSIIRVDNAGFLPVLAQALRLYAIPEVREEYREGSRGGEFPSGVRVLERAGDRGLRPEADERPRHVRGPDQSTSPQESASLPTDLRILQTARNLHFPILSEDRKILQKAELAGLEYYNALMMLEFLLYRGEMGGAAYEKSKELILSQARYGRGVLRYAESLHAFILKGGTA